MLNDNAKKWVEALRSSNYQQGRNHLNRDNTFCCLGVACELAIKDGIDVSVDHGGNVVKYDNYAASLPRSVRTWLGLASSFGDFDEAVERNGKAWNSLAGLNDEGMTFAEIANFIESEPAGLFLEETVA